MRSREPGGHAVNTDTVRTPFTDHVEGLVLQKRSVGYRYDAQAAILKRFDRFCLRYHADEATLSKKIVTHWAERRPGESIGTLGIRVSAVRQLAIYLNKLGGEAYVIPSRTLPKYPGYIPYIFTDRELEAFFCRVDACSPGEGSHLRHLVLPVLFRLLYCCGLRVSEATHLKVRDVDLAEGILSIRKAKFGKERRVPVSQETISRLRAYSEQVRTALAAQDSVFLPSPSGQELSTTTVYGNFRTFLWEAGIPHGGPGKGPRVHDLRHTYAVHCLKRWVEEGKDLSAYLPLLTAYLGHAHFRETSYYLRLTADLYPTITAQVERAFGEIVPREGGTR